MSSPFSLKAQIERIKAAAAKQAANSVLTQSAGDDGSVFLELEGLEGRELLFAISPSGRLFYTAGSENGLISSDQKLEEILRWVDFSFTSLVGSISKSEIQRGSRGTIVYTRQEYLDYCDKECQKMLGMSFKDAKNQVDIGKLEGTLAEARVKMLRSLLEGPHEDQAQVRRP